MSRFCLLGSGVFKLNYKYKSMSLSCPVVNVLQGKYVTWLTMVFAHSNGLGSSLTQPQLDTPQSKIIFFSYYHLLHARIISD